MEVFERIKQRRKEIGLSAETVAIRLGVSPATVYRYEKNDIKKFPTEILEPLANVLHTTPAYLMGWQDTPELEVSSTFLSEHEKALIDAYRRSPDLQFAIDKLLNVVSPQKIYTKQDRPLEEQTDDD